MVRYKGSKDRQRKQLEVVMWNKKKATVLLRRVRFDSIKVIRYEMSEQKKKEHLSFSEKYDYEYNNENCQLADFHGKNHVNPMNIMVFAVYLSQYAKLSKMFQTQLVDLIEKHMGHSILD